MWCLLIFWIHLWWTCLSPTILNPGGKPHMWTCTNIWALSSGIHESLKASWQTSELNLHNMAKWSPDTMLHNSIWEHKRRSWICSKDDSKASRNFIVTSRDGLSLINRLGLGSRSNGLVVLTPLLGPFTFGCNILPSNMKIGSYTVGY